MSAMATRSSLSLRSVASTYRRVVSYQHKLSFQPARLTGLCSHPPIRCLPPLHMGQTRNVSTSLVIRQSSSNTPGQEPVTEPAKEEDQDKESENEQLVIEKWTALVDSIKDKTKEAVPSSPPFDPSSPSVYQDYWRNIFSQLRESISNDPAIPHFLTEPPVKKFAITFMDTIHALNCPCCHPYTEPNILIENEDGVTKTDLVDGFIDAAYGATLPRVYKEPEYYFHPDKDLERTKDSEDIEWSEEVEFTDDSGVVVFESSWLIASGGEADQRVVYDPEQPDVYFYCCRPDIYESAKHRLDEYWDNRKNA